MESSDRNKLIAVVAMLLVACFFFVNFLRSNRASGEQAFFYDLSERKLFEAPRDSIPPIKGLNNAEEDAVRAVVISTSGEASDKKSRKIAYLERYSAELKAQMEQARKSAGSPEMGRGEAMNHRFVKRVDDPDWHAMNTPMGEQIVSEWATPGPNGITPVVCTP